MTDQAERGAAIVVRDLTKSYPIAGKAGTPPEGGAGAPPDGGRKGKRGARMRKHVLDGVSFTVPTGAIVSFLGHNGAGKTTLIRILSTLITADSGEVSIFSRDVKEDPAGVRADIATTGQFAAIDENLTGRENLEFFGRLRGLDRAAAAARATELLAQFSLADSASTLASAYSGGMRRRLDIAASLCVVPRLLFLDEPTTGLDPVSREELWGFIRQLRDDGMTL
ncbi:ABC transporter ATP-binding protein, partial [Corynebacterium sp. S1S1]